MKLPSKVILSRSLLVLAACALLYFCYLLVGIFLSPVPVPPVPSPKKSVSFDPSLDVSKQPVFAQLRSLGAVNVSTTNLGRDNPFIPVPTTTATAVFTTPTSTGAEAASASSSTPVASSTATTNPTVTSTAP